jgi:dTDP-4-dehydrorhamnose reductase
MSDYDGVYHVIGPDFTSRYNWTRLIADIFSYDLELITEGHSGDANLPAQRPSNHLSNRKIRQVTDIRLYTLEEGLYRMTNSEQAEF